MGLRFDPIGGGKFKQLVQGLIQAERRPILALEKRREIQNVKMQLFQDFKARFADIGTSLNALSDPKKFRELKVDLGDGKELMDVTLDPTRAQPGSYQMKINELATRSSIFSNGFESPEKSFLGIGFIVAYDSEGDPYEIFVDESDATLYGIAQKINDDPDAPIRATVVKDASEPENPWKLIVNSKHDGFGRGVDIPEFYFLDGDERIWHDDTREAWNALVEINDYVIETESNKVQDFLQGVNIHIKGARPDRGFLMTISEDHEKITEKVQGLVDRLNGILEFISEQNRVDQNTDTRTMFTGDTSLQSIEYRIRNQMHEGFPVGNWSKGEGRVAWLGEFGIEFNKSGKIVLNENKFNQAMEKDFDNVSEAISGEFGLAHQLKQVLDQYTRPMDGLLANREKGLRDRIRQIDRQIENQERQVERRAQALTDKFSRLQSALGGLQQQQAYMQANLGGGGGNPITQLLS